MKRIALIAAFALCATATFAAENPMADMVVKHWKASQGLTIAVAEAMPDKDYGFKPNPEEMSFGEQMIHIGLANASYVARAAGEKSPFTKPEKSDKATAMKVLNDTYEYCLGKISTMSTEAMHKVSGPEGRQMSGFEAIWGGFTHTAHHRGQAEVYLRLKNIKPPTYVF